MNGSLIALTTLPRPPKLSEISTKLLRSFPPKSTLKTFSASWTCFLNLSPKDSLIDFSASAKDVLDFSPISTKLSRKTSIFLVKPKVPVNFRMSLSSSPKRLIPPVWSSWESFSITPNQLNVLIAASPVGTPQELMSACISFVGLIKPTKTLRSKVSVVSALIPCCDKVAIAAPTSSISIPNWLAGWRTVPSEPANSSAVTRPKSMTLKNTSEARLVEIASLPYEFVTAVNKFTEFVRFELVIFAKIAAFDKNEKTSAPRAAWFDNAS